MASSLMPETRSKGAGYAYKIYIYIEREKDREGEKKRRGGGDYEGLRSVQDMLCVRRGTVSLISPIHTLPATHIYNIRLALHLFIMRL